MFPQVRNLKWLGFRVPLAIVNKAHQANQLYPFAISLIESVRTYERTCDKIDERPSAALLVAGMRKEIQGYIAEVQMSFLIFNHSEAYGNFFFLLSQKVFL